jgi:molybdenum cofactor cytidylyltransferase
MTRVSAILLAAGESRRMGELNKLELPVCGEPLLRRTARTLLASRLIEVVVVLGHEAARARRLLDGLTVTVVENRQYHAGQMTSVWLGLDALDVACEGVMVCLADQPLLTAADINALIDGFGQRRRGSVLVPVFAGQRGNPIILAQEHRAEILDAERNLGCRRLIERNPGLVTTIEMPNDHVVFDLDTPGDYAALQCLLQGGTQRVVAQ